MKSYVHLVQKLLFQQIAEKDLLHQVKNEMATLDFLCCNIGWLEAPFKVPAIHYN